MENTSKATTLGLKIEKKVKFYFTYLLQTIFMGFLFLTQLSLYPFLYLINLSFKLFSYFIKGTSLIFTLMFSGIDGVRKKIGRHYHTNEIHYAVLKGNGQYLKL